MTKAGLIAVLGNGTGLTRSKAEAVVRVFFDELSNALAKGDRVEIRGFGTFKIKNYDGYTGHNPKTGEPIKVKPKKLPFFKCSRELKERVDTYK